MPAETPPWELGPFRRPADAQPIIKPNPNTLFDCPMRRRPVRWQATHTFNPAAAVRDGKVYVLYRAEDDIGHGIGGYTSRLGLAVSDDGVRFDPLPDPVLYPTEDDQKAREWEGGCEDPRIAELEDGSYVLFYTQYRKGGETPRAVNVGIATSTDLTHWTKHGPLVARNGLGRKIVPRKSASLVCEVRDGRLVAKKIDGRYWLYCGEGSITVFSSPDLRAWTAGEVVLRPRHGYFDSRFAECGPPAVLTDRGIVLLYNGNLKPGVYANGQALFDANDPAKLLARSETPFFQPELPWEATGQYAAGTTFIEGLVLFKERWFLYYGCADSYVGVATADYQL